MKKLNLIAASAALLVAGMANAGTLASATAGGTLFAVEDFGPTTTAATGITPGAITYTIGTTNGIVINAGGKIYLTVRLAGGTWSAAPAVGTIGGTALAVGGAGNGVVSAPTLSSDGTTAVYTVTYTAGVTLGVGSTFTYTPAALSVLGTKSALGTVGGTVSASVSLSAITPVVQAPSTTYAPNTGTAQAADIDGPVGTAVIAKTVQGVTLSTSSLPAYTGRIDLTASPAASKYALLAAPGVAVPAALGSVTATDATTAGNALNGSTAVNTAAAVAGPTNALSVVVTPGTNQAFPIGATLYLDITSSACGAPVAGTTSAAVTSTTTTTAITLTLPSASTTTGVPAFICMTAPSAGNTATPLTVTLNPQLNFTLTTATSGIDSATGTGFALGYNGSSYTLNTYFPAAISQYGYSTYTRVVNTGSVAANVSAAYVDGTTGLTGTSAVIATSLQPGAAVLLNNTTIEAALAAAGAAAPAVNARPRLNITAPTNGLRVQNFVQSANGTFTEVSSQQQ
ncbi:MAG: hypothetical protein JO006_10035 [Paucibacter sp.]|nr:hypothetical protein [Roseateles sp.]